MKCLGPGFLHSQSMSCCAPFLGFSEPLHIDGVLHAVLTQSMCISSRRGCSNRHLAAWISNFVAGSGVLPFPGRGTCSAPCFCDVDGWWFWLRAVNAATVIAGTEAVDATFLVHTTSHCADSAGCVFNYGGGGYAYSGGTL